MSEGSVGTLVDHGQQTQLSVPLCTERYFNTVICCLMTSNDVRCTSITCPMYNVSITTLITDLYQSGFSHTAYTHSSLTAGGGETGMLSLLESRCHLYLYVLSNTHWTAMFPVHY